VESFLFIRFVVGFAEEMQKPKSIGSLVMAVQLISSQIAGCCQFLN